MIIRLRNFGIYEDTGVINIPSGLSLILGKFADDDNRSNGSGKSSLIEGITFGCWGEARTTNEFPSGDGLIRRPPQGKKMEIDLDIDGIVINRGRKYNSSSSLVVTHHGKTIAGNHANTQKQLESLLGINYDIFSHTFYIPVHGTGLFTQLKPTEAKRKIIDMLALSRWDDRKKAINADIIELRSTIASINTQIDAHISNLPGKLDDLNTLREQYIQGKIGLELELVGVSNNNKKLADEVLEINARLSDIQREIDANKELQNNISRTKRRLEDLNSRIQNKDDQLTKVKNGIAVIEDRILSINCIISELEINGKELYKIIDRDSSTYEGLINKKNEYHDKLISSTYTCKDTMKECDKIRDMIKKLEDMGVITCPITSNTCPVLSNQDDVSGHITEQKLMMKGMNIKLSEVKRQHEELVNASTLIDKEIEQLDGARNRYDAILADIDTNNRQKESFNRELSLAKSMIESHDMDKARLVDDYNSMKDELNRLSNNGALSTSTIFEYNALIKHRNDLMHNIDAADGEIKIIERKIMSVSNDIAVLDDSIKRYYDITDRIDGLRAESLKHDVVLSDLSILSNAFGMDGIPTYIIDSASAEIESVANDILEMSDQSVRISILLKEETKTKDIINGGFKVKDTFKINLLDSNTGDEFSYDSNSAGEQFWIDFSLRMALGVCVRTRSNMGIDIFLIDEGLGVLDKLAQRKFINILKNIMDKYSIKYIWLITHTNLSYAGEFVDNVITCYRDGDKSLIKVE